MLPCRDSKCLLGSNLAGLKKKVGDGRGATMDTAPIGIKDDTAGLDAATN